MTAGGSRPRTPAKISPRPGPGADPREDLAAPGSRRPNPLTLVALGLAGVLGHLVAAEPALHARRQLGRQRRDIGAEPDRQRRHVDLGAVRLDPAHYRGAHLLGGVRADAGR